MVKSNLKSEHQKLKIGIVVANFNELVTSRLAEGAKKQLLKRSVELSHIFVYEVPGSFELPLAAQFLIDHKNVDGVICLGAVIRGTTDHYDYVCSGTTSGIMNVQLTRSTPLGFGILTCDTMEQALDRAGGKLGNKGAEAADVVLDMIALKHSLKNES
ncbi:MAG: 6,7-dimethyl-8-ribityllumazine synthase [Silvanigrellaceae bacterium]|nr:6,7-dimethyl-8-ribityllumazine synthase [Silvanigrellaceae bacterium]